MSVQSIFIYFTAHGELKIQTTNELIYEDIDEVESSPNEDIVWSSMHEHPKIITVAKLSKKEFRIKRMIMVVKKCGEKKAEIFFSDESFKPSDFIRAKFLKTSTECGDKNCSYIHHDKVKPLGTHLDLYCSSISIKPVRIIHYDDQSGHFHWANTTNVFYRDTLNMFIPRMTTTQFDPTRYQVLRIAVDDGCCSSQVNRDVDVSSYVATKFELIKEIRNDGKNKTKLTMYEFLSQVFEKEEYVREADCNCELTIKFKVLRPGQDGFNF